MCDFLPQCLLVLGQAGENEDDDNDNNTHWELTMYHISKCFAYNEC